MVESLEALLVVDDPPLIAGKRGLQGGVLLHRPGSGAGGGESTAPPEERGSQRCRPHPPSPPRLPFTSFVRTIYRREPTKHRLRDRFRRPGDSPLPARGRILLGLSEEQVRLFYPHDLLWNSNGEWPGRETARKRTPNASQGKELRQLSSVSFADIVEPLGVYQVWPGSGRRC